MLIMQLFIQPDYYGYTGMDKANYEQWVPLCMSGRARHLPETNLATVHSAVYHSHVYHSHVYHSQPALSYTIVRLLP